LDPTFLFFLSLIVLVVLATTNDILSWSDAEGALRKKKKLLARRLKPVDAPATSEAKSLGAKGRLDGEARSRELQDKVL